MKKIYVLSVLLLSGMLFQGCEKEEITEVDEMVFKPVNSTQSFSVQEMSSWDVFFFEASEDPLNGYKVKFQGAQKETVEGKVVSTTFSYLVSGVGETAQMDSFYLGVPECAGADGPISWTPTQSSKLEDQRLKWNSSVSKDGNQQFTITYSGDVAPGLIEATVVRGGIEYSQDVVGACAGAYDLQGYVFIDANEDGIKQLSESGIEGYTVVLEQGGNLAEDVSSADGIYSFRVLPGDYKLWVKNNLLGEEYYIPEEDYLPNATDKKDVTVPTELSADFGYKAVTSKMTEDFSDGDIMLTTASAREWGQQIKMAGKSNSSFTVQDVNDLLLKVDALLPDVFNFNFGNNRIQGALDILTKPIKTDEDLFLQQLLAAELNHVYGRGAVDDDQNLKNDFNLALIKYAEAKALGETISSDGLSIMATTSRSYSLSGASTLLASFNDNGSGGL